MRLQVWHDVLTKGNLNFSVFQNVHFMRKENILISLVGAPFDRQTIQLVPEVGDYDPGFDFVSIEISDKNHIHDHTTHQAALVRQIKFRPWNVSIGSNKNYLHLYCWNLQVNGNIVLQNIIEQNGNFMVIKILNGIKISTRADAFIRHIIMDGWG